MKINSENNETNQKSLNLTYITEKQKNPIKSNYAFLLSHKLSIEKTLSLIKKFQLECISSTKPYNKNLLKQFLFMLKDNLIFSLNEKRKMYQRIIREKEEKTKNLQNILFSINEETVKIKNCENNNIYIRDLNQLKTLNFEIENKIKSIDFSLEQKNKIIKTKSLIDKEKEIYKSDKDKYNLNISNILDYNMKNIRKKLIDTNKINMEKKMKLDLVSNKIFNLKNNNKDYTFNKEIKNKNKKNEKEQSNEFLKTTVTINKNEIIDNKNKEKIYRENDKESFHSSLYTDSFSINKDEVFYSTKNDRNIGDILNLSNDYINTDNSNNIHFSDKAIFNNECNNKISERNYIFSNISDNELNINNVIIKRF